jgi:uncharacterized damage-inducible protein DinB
MTNREFCIARRKAEFPAFVRVLKALPQDRLDYRPDPRSRTAAELAWVLPAEEAALLSLVETGSVTWQEQAHPATVAEIVAAYEKHASAVTEAISRMDDAAWEKKGRFFVAAGAPPWESEISGFLWGFLFDAIHHRGQLSTYLRPMGGKVPSIYGPSADDPGGA